MEKPKPVSGPDDSTVETTIALDRASTTPTARADSTDAVVSKVAAITIRGQQYYRITGGSGEILLVPLHPRRDQAEVEQDILYQASGDSDGFDRLLDVGTRGEGVIDDRCPNG